MDDEEEFGDFEADSAANQGSEFFGKQNPIERAARAQVQNTAEAPGISGGAERAAVIAAMRKQKASWQTDGLGLRGHATVVSNASANLLWGSSRVSRRANPELDAGDIEVAAEVPEAPAP